MKILYFANDLVCPATTGARQRTYLQLEALRELGQLRVVVITRHHVTPDELSASEEAFGPISVLRTQDPGRLVPWSLARWIHPRVVDRCALALDFRPLALLPSRSVADAASRIATEYQPDICMTRYYMAARPAETWRFANSILDLDDVDSSFLRNSLHDPATEPWRRIIIRARLRNLERVFRSDLEKFRALTLASAADLPQVPGLNARALPNIPFTNQGMGQDPLPPARNSTQILVVATWGYMPNILGLNRFLASAWPAIRARVRSATLNVVGMNMRPQEKQAWASIPGVILTGFAHDLSAEYAKAACCIAPVYQGGGTKIKVLEALSFARACVVTEHAHHGYEDTLPSPAALLRATSDSEMADACVRLLLDPDLRDRTAAEGYARVRQHFSFNALRETLHALVRDVTSKDSRTPRA